MNQKRRRLWHEGDTAGTPRTRALAAALRSALSESGRTARQAAHLLDKSHTTISQWQTGKRVPTADDVSALLAVLGVTGQRRQQILDLAHHASESNWLAAGVSQHLDGILECERTAAEIVDWCPLVISGLFQTHDYADAIIGSDDALSRGEVESRVSLRVERRATLLNRESNPVDYQALIGECALRQAIGGDRVLLDQLRQLRTLADQKEITIQVVPIGAGWHPGLMGPFVIYNFADVPSIVALEHHQSSVFLYDDDDVTAYKRAAASVRRAALTPAGSLEFIADLVERMEK